jgi:hypothetical protein
MKVKFSGKDISFAMTEYEYNAASDLIDLRELIVQERGELRKKIKQLKTLEGELNNKVMKLAISNIARELDVNENEVRKLSKYKYRETRRERLSNEG